MGMSGGQSGQTMSEINVTPLVDVMLVLLIIFMVTAPMLNNAGIEVDLPKAETPPLDMDDEEQLVLTMDAERMVWIDETSFTVDELGPKLTAIAEANPERPVFLRADGNLPYKEVVGLLELAKQAGMPRVGLVFDPTGTEEDDE